MCPEHSKQAATLADHVVPHRGDYALFWFGELQSLCKACHDIKKQRVERRGSNRRRWGWSIPHGLQPSAIPVTLVCGPPAAGKSTYVARSKAPDDLVIDMDVFLAKCGGAKWETRPEIVGKAFQLRDDMLRALPFKTKGRAWLPMTAADPSERAGWLDALGPLAEVVIVAPPKAQVLAQMRADPRRSDRWDDMAREIDRWFRLNPDRGGAKVRSRATADRRG